MNVLAQSIGSWFWKICIFLGIIFLLHQIFLYLKETFTTPKKTNIIQLHKNQYNEIEKMIKHQEYNQNHEKSLVRETNSIQEENMLSEEQKKYLANSLLKLLDNTSN